jgi:hypothetical protein
MPDGCARCAGQPDYRELLAKLEARANGGLVGPSYVSYRGEGGEWLIEWTRIYPDGIESDKRRVYTPTLEAALTAALEWEDDNDREEPEHA